MNHRLTLSTTLSPLLVDISPDKFSSDVSSDTASYGGSHLVPGGNMTLDHDLDPMKGEVATINKGAPSLEFFSIHLENDASILLKSQRQLFSTEGKTEIDALFPLKGNR